MKLNCCHYDLCLPDYFPGHHAPWAYVPIYGPMTLKAIKEYLINEINQGAIGGYRDTDNERIYRAMVAAVKRMRFAKKGTRLAFKDVDVPDPDDDWAEPVNAYFVFLDDDDRFNPEDWMEGKS